MEAKIILVYEDQKEAKAVSEAISPDNSKTPKNLSVATSWVKNRVETSIKYDGENLMTMLSTIDDLLSSVSVAEKVYLTIKKRR